jgi:hypothetical protein
MKSRALVGPSADAQTQRDLEDMRAELLHEIQDGDEGEDERVEVVSFQVALIRGRPAKEAPAREALTAA